MRKVVLTEFITLDGVIEAPNVWSMSYWSDEIGKVKYDELFASDAMLLGRVTYEGFAAAWPTMTGTGEFGERMNSLPKHVASRTLTETTWNATVIQGEIPEAVARLKEEPGQDILVGGSGTLAQTLMQHALIDEYRLMVYPVVVGSGARLFREGGPTPKLRLAETKTFDSGVVLLTYEAAR